MVYQKKVRSPLVHQNSQPKTMISVRTYITVTCTKTCHELPSPIKIIQGHLSMLSTAEAALYDVQDDPSQLITLPGARVCLVLRDEEEFPTINMTSTASVNSRATPFMFPPDQKITFADVLD